MSRLLDWLEPYILKVDAWLQDRLDASARIVRVTPSDASPYYVVEVKSFDRWIPRVFSATPDYAEAERWWRRETNREAWPTTHRETIDRSCTTRKDGA